MFRFIENSIKYITWSYTKFFWLQNFFFFSFSHSSRIWFCVLVDFQCKIISNWKHCDVRARTYCSIRTAGADKWEHNEVYFNTSDWLMPEFRLKERNSRLITDHDRWPYLWKFWNFLILNGNWKIFYYIKNQHQSILVIYLLHPFNIYNFFHHAENFWYQIQIHLTGIWCRISPPRRHFLKSNRKFFLGKFQPNFVTSELLSIIFLKHDVIGVCL